MGLFGKKRKSKGFSFGRGPKTEKIWARAPSQKSQKKPANYQYSIVQSKDQRVKTFNSREEAVIHMNRLKETQPSMKYRMVVEKKPGNQWW